MEQYHLSTVAPLPLTEQAMVRSFKAFESADLCHRWAVAAVQCAGRSPRHNNYRHLCLHVIDRMLSSTHDISTFVGAVCTFYQHYGGVESLVQLLDASVSHPTVRMHASFWRQYMCSLCHHDICAGFRLTRMILSDPASVSAFDHTRPQQSERDLEHWSEYSSATRAAIILCGIVISACARAANAESTAIRLVKHPVPIQVHGMDVACAAIAYASDHCLPTTVEMVGRSIHALSAPESSMYHSQRLSPPCVWLFIRSHFGKACISTPAAGAWVGNALVRCCGQADRQLDRMWRVVQEMLLHGFTLPSGREGGKLVGMATTSRALKIAVRSVCMRVNIKQTQYEHSYRSQIVSRFDSLAPRTRFVPTTLGLFMDRVSTSSTRFGTPFE